MKKHLKVTVEGEVFEVDVEILGETSQMTAPVETKKVKKPSSGTDLKSPLSGKIVSIEIKEGDVVETGQKVMTLEAMKMNTIVTSTCDGRVASIEVSVGETVEEGRPLVVFE